MRACGVGLSQRERVLWTCASFCLPVLLLLSLPFTWGGFVARDKYILFILLLAIVPLAGFAAARPSMAISSLVSDRSLNRFLAFNLGFILLITPWLAAAKFGEPLSAIAWRLLAVFYLFAIAGLGAVAFRFAELPSRHPALDIANRILIVVTPVA